MTFITYENGKRAGACQEIAASSPLLGGFKMLTILPIPSTRDGVTITGTGKTLDSLASEGEAGEIYLGYGIPEWLSDALRGAGAVVVDAERDEEFLIENARLTAYATVCRLLSEFEVSPDAVDVGVVGYGRIGRALLRLLLPLGYSVTVYSTRDDVVNCLCSSGVDSLLVTHGDPLPCHDVLINTAPATLFDCTGGLPRGMRIYELAGGVHFGELELTNLPSLPNRYFPISAGRAYAAALLRALGGEG